MDPFFVTAKTFNLLAGFTINVSNTNYHYPHSLNSNFRGNTYLSLGASNLTPTKEYVTNTERNWPGLKVRLRGLPVRGSQGDLQQHHHQHTRHLQLQRGRDNKTSQAECFCLDVSALPALRRSHIPTVLLSAKFCNCCLRPQPQSVGASIVELRQPYTAQPTITVNSELWNLIRIFH